MFTLIDTNTNNSTRKLRRMTGQWPDTGDHYLRLDSRPEDWGDQTLSDLKFNSENWRQKLGWLRPGPRRPLTPTDGDLRLREISDLAGRHLSLCLLRTFIIKIQLYSSEYQISGGYLHICMGYLIPDNIWNTSIQNKHSWRRKYLYYASFTVILAKPKFIRSLLFLEIWSYGRGRRAADVSHYQGEMVSWAEV